MSGNKQQNELPEDLWRKILGGENLTQNIQVQRDNSYVARLSREEHIAEHFRHLNEINNIHQDQIIVSTTHNAVKKSSVTCTSSSLSNPSILKSFRPIRASELKVHRAPYKGCVFYCTIVVPCLEMRSAHTLVEEGDDGGGDLISLHVYNMKNPSKELYVGRKMAVLEPFYKMRADQTPGIRVDDPSNEIIFDVEDDSTTRTITKDESMPNPLSSNTERPPLKDVASKNTEQGTSCNTDTGANALMIPPQRKPELHRVVSGKQVFALKKKGNAYFSSRLFKEAETAYSDALELCRNIKSHKGTATDDDEDHHGVEVTKAGSSSSLDDDAESVDLWMLYANRSAARLKQGILTLAWEDAKMSHLCAPIGPTKPVVRVAQALLALGLKNDAVTFLEQELGCAESRSYQEPKLIESMLKRIGSIPVLHVGPKQKYRTLLAAVLAAPAGSEILVDAGIYEESIIITKPLTIRSSAAPPPEFIDSSADILSQNSKEISWAEIRFSFMCPVVVKVQDEDSKLTTPGLVQIIGFHIVMSGLGPLFGSYPALLLDEQGSVLLRSCSFQSSTGPIFGCDNGVATVEDCSFYDGAQGGILVEGSKARLFLSRCQVCYNAACGLELRQGGSASLTSCQLFANGRQGILIWCGAGAFRAKDCEIHSHPKESGIMVRENFPHNALFVNCKMYANGIAGIVVEDNGHARMEECHMLENGGDGILLQGKASAHIESCVAKNNVSHGIFVGFDHNRSCSVKIISNRLQDNQGKGIFLGVNHKKISTSKNSESGNRGVPYMNPSLSLVDQFDTAASGNKGRIVNEQLRQWAKRTKKNQRKEESKSFSVASFADVVLGCGYCGTKPTPGEKFHKCSRCLSVVYCSKSCQRKGWKEGGHKHVCHPPKADHPSFVDPMISLKDKH